MDPYDLEALRRQYTLGGGGSVYNSDEYPLDDSAGSGYNDYAPDLPSAYPPNININGQPPAQLPPQNPFTAQLFRQSLEPDTSDKVDVGDDYRSLYHPQSMAQERLNKLLDNFPQQENPSFARKLAAMASGIGGAGIKGEQAILDEPNNRAIERWKTQADPFLRAADNERQSNINERTLAQQTIAARQNQQKIDETAKKDREVAASRETRDRAYAWAKEHPTWKTDFSGTRIISVGMGPDGTMQKLDLGPTSHLDDKTKLEIAGQYKVDAAKALGTSREAVAGITTDPRTIYDMQDPNFPNDPTKRVPARINPVTHELEQIQLKGAGGTTRPATGTINRPGSGNAKPTTQPGNIQAIQTMTKQTLGALDDVISDKGELNPNVSSVVGAHRYNPATWFGGLPNTSYVTANNSIKRLHDMLVLDLIGEMKAQSRTGATGFGALSGPELSILENSATKLDPSMPTEDFIAELKRIRGYLNKIVQPPDQFTPTKTDKIMTPQEWFDQFNKARK